jgi:hypothetical protein
LYETTKLEQEEISYFGVHKELTINYFRWFDQPRINLTKSKRIVQAPFTQREPKIIFLLASFEQINAIVGTKSDSNRANLAEATCRATSSLNLAARY